MMKTLQVSAALFALLAVSATATSSFGQESTRADFDDFCNMMKGRWVGDVIWVADWPGFGKKGDKVTAYIESKVEMGGNALIGRYFGGSGTGVWIATYDAGSKQIKELCATSGGTVWNNIYFKKNGKWTRKSTGSNPDGSKIKGSNTLNVSDGGKTHRWRGPTTIEGKDTDELQDVWRKVSD